MEQQPHLIKDDLRHIKVVDSAEPDQIRSSLLETGWRQQRLQSGDFMFYTCQYHTVGLTRKTVQDFLTSLNQNFSKQLEEMLEVYDICVLLVENPWKWSQDTGRMITNRGLEWQVKKGVLNFIHRFQAKGFILERTLDWRDTVSRLNELYALYQKPYSLSARSKGYPDERLLALPSGLRGKAGLELLEGRSLLAIAGMNTTQLQTVTGIGKGRAQLIYNHFNKVGGDNA